MRTQALKISLVGAALAGLSLIGFIAQAQTAEQDTTMPPPTSQTQPSPPPPPPDQLGATSQGRSFSPSQPPLPPQGERGMMGGTDSRYGYQQKPMMPPLPSMMQGERMNANQKMGQPGFGSQGQGNFNQNRQSMGQNGLDVANEQDQNNNEAEQQKREEAMVKKQAAQMARMFNQAVNQINKRVATLKKRGFSLTQECSDTITVFADATVKAKSATTMDDLDDLQDAAHSMEDLNDCRQLIDHLIGAPKLLKNATNTIKNLKRRKVDVSEAEPLLQNLTSQLSRLKSGIPSNDDIEAFFDAMDTLGDVVAPLMENKSRRDIQGASVFQSGGGLWDSIMNWLGF